LKILSAHDRSPEAQAQGFYAVHKGAFFSGLVKFA
jgi:hypothetical protein